MTYTREELIKFAETLGTHYRFDYDKKTWNMQTHLAPGMLHETTDQLIDRFFDTPKKWDERMKKIGLKKS